MCSQIIREYAFIILCLHTGSGMDFEALCVYLHLVIFGESKNGFLPNYHLGNVSIHLFSFD
jgi:hypothetical protein